MNFDEFLQPAIYGLTGKPGAGKSYFATRLIIAEITKGKNRPIVSNVPINVPKLREYCRKDFYYYPLETYTDNKAFFTNRGNYHIEDLPSVENIDFKPLLHEDDEGVLFVIDEAHLYFNARNWKHMPQATISYITTIRHIGDSLVWMCQKFSDIDSQIRGKTQAFHYLRNLEKEKLGIFKRGVGFRCYQYQHEHEIEGHGKQGTNSSQDFSYPFEIKVAECYNTSLFNKSHDKKYKIKAIPLNYVIYAGISCFLIFLYWVSTGGITQMMRGGVSSITDMADIKREEVTSTVSAVEQVLPPSDPMIVTAVVTQKKYEVPALMFQTKSQANEPFQEISDDDYTLKKDYWFGINRKCKLTFISDKETVENTREFSFSALWQDFAQIAQVDLSSEYGIWRMRSNYFSSFITFVKDTGRGANLKEVDIILKENVPYTMQHGFQLPQTSSVATQGVIRTMNSYMDVGFQLDLSLEAVDGNEMLKVIVDNTDVMDMTSENPIIQSFRSSNVFDVQEYMTYQIADFKSQTGQKTNGIFKKNDYQTQVTNKIFITYGKI